MKDRFRVLLLNSIAKHCVVLNELNVSSNNLNNQDAKDLAGMLTHHQHLESLTLEWNNITGTGTDVIAKSLLKNDTLTTLNLNYNTAGAHASSFAIPLLMNTTLKNLYLSSNSINGPASIVLCEYLLETTHPLHELAIDSNPITMMGARCCLQVLARGVNISKFSFMSEFHRNKSLSDTFSPLYLPKSLTLNLNIPFQRAQATMLLRRAAEDAGFELATLKYIENDDSNNPSSSSGEEITLVRQCIDLETVSIKEYKKHFMRLCRRNNPNKYYTSINQAHILTSQARELLTVSHKGVEPCDLMHNIIISAFDANDDGIIEWEEFHEGMLSARSMFGPTIRRIGQKPIGIMIRKDDYQLKRYQIPMNGYLEINYDMVSMPKLIHNEMTRNNFLKIMNIVNSCTPQNKLKIIHLLIKDSALSSTQAIQLSRKVENYPNDTNGSIAIDTIVEILLSVTNKTKMCFILQHLTSTTRILIRKIMRNNYRVILGVYTGRFTIDLSLGQDRMVINQILQHYNLLVKNGLGNRNSSSSSTSAHHGDDDDDGGGGANTCISHNEISDTSQNQDWLHCSNVTLNSSAYSLLPHVLAIVRSKPGTESSSSSSLQPAIVPLPDHGILQFDLVEIEGPDPSMKILSDIEFSSFLQKLELGSISGVMPLTTKETSGHCIVDQGSIHDPDNKDEVQMGIGEGIKCRLATSVEIVMATRITNAARGLFARRRVSGKVFLPVFHDFVFVREEYIDLLLLLPV
jgi:hypothetical protein